jgi:aldehyde dehydrogenase (NAD+)
MVMSGRFYIDGQWVDALSGRSIDVLDPRTERSIGRIGAAGAEDVDRAVRAARRAFDGFADLSRKDRRDLLGAIVAIYERRLDEIAEVISAEMGAPRTLARAAHAPLGLIHFRTAYEEIEHFRFEREEGRLTLCREAIGVCGLITPWNWPANQIAAKVAPALAVGCTMVLKPSEISPYSAEIIAQIIAEAGVPAGVFNLIQGDGPTAGAALSSHPDVDMVSFTGSTRGGIAVAQAAAPTIKRVHQELGGKSANIVLPDADFPLAIARGVRAVMNNSGQTCSAPTRMLVPADRMEEAKAIAAATAAAIPIGSEDQPGAMGPVVSEAQWTKIQRLIGIGVAEGAALIAGGEGRPEGFDAGYYVRPTIFADVRPDMTIAREEIFGPVLSILPYRDEDEAVAIANDSDYGLAGFVDSQDLDHARRIARRLRVGQVRINHPPMHPLAPFGGYKQSGNGREWGAQAFEEFTEVKAVVTP